MAVDSLGTMGASAPVSGSTFLLWSLAVMVFGAMVGAAELISRYRDDPWRSLLRREGVAYVLLNGAVSVAVFAMLDYSRDAILPNLSTMWRAIVSGFGAMALLRSKFFTFRTASDEDIPVGLEAAVSAFLQALDRGVDRTQSWRRWELAFPYLRDIPDQATLDQLVSFCVQPAQLPERARQRVPLVRERRPGAQVADHRPRRPARDRDRDRDLGDRRERQLRQARGAVQAARGAGGGEVRGLGGRTDG
jgi:hypothetical protein